VLDAENKAKSEARFALMKATQVTIENALNIIGVEAPERM
jgi:arginyl-tRNA synthetase